MNTMTKDEFKNKFEEVKRRAFNIFFSNSPVDIGYLRSMIILTETSTGFVISNDVSYMQYTEEKWNRPSGRQNPNEGWFRVSMEQAFNYIVKEMKT